MTITPEELRYIQPFQFKKLYPNGIEFNVKGRMTGYNSTSHIIHPETMKGIHFNKTTNTPISCLISDHDSYGSIDSWKESGIFVNHKGPVSLNYKLNENEEIIYEGQKGNTKHSQITNASMDNIVGTNQPIRIVIYYNKSKIMKVLGYYQITQKAYNVYFENDQQVSVPVYIMAKY